MRKFYEKLSICIVIFLGVVIATSSIIGIYVKDTRGTKNNYKDSIILD